VTLSSLTLRPQIGPADRPVWSIGGMVSGKGIPKPIPMSLSPAQILHDYPRACSRAYAVRSWRVFAWPGTVGRYQYQSKGNKLFGFSWLITGSVSTLRSRKNVPLIDPPPHLHRAVALPCSTPGLSNAAPAGAMAPATYFPGTLFYSSSFNVNPNFKKTNFWITVCFNFFRSTPMNTVFPLLQTCFLL
jgi:hypothetical protein